MESTPLGRFGLKVSRIALGCMSFGDSSRGFSQWSLGEDEAQPFFRQAVELGINFWDTANVYTFGSSEELQAAARGRPAGWTRFVSMQDEYNLIMREEEREMFGLLADSGVGAIPFSPLAKGRVCRPWGERTARMDTDPVGRRYDQEMDAPIVDAVQRIAEARGVPMAQVALAWVLKHPVITAPIVGATKPHHLADAVAALDLQLSAEEVRSLEEPYVPNLPKSFS